MRLPRFRFRTGLKGLLLFQLVIAAFLAGWLGRRAEMHDAQIRALAESQQAYDTWATNQAEIQARHMLRKIDESLKLFDNYDQEQRLYQLREMIP